MDECYEEWNKFFEVGAEGRAQSYTLLTFSTIFLVILRML